MPSGRTTTSDKVKLKRRQDALQRYADKNREKLRDAARERMRRRRAALATQAPEVKRAHRAQALKSAAKYRERRVLRALNRTLTQSQQKSCQHSHRGPEEEGLEAFDEKEGRKRMSKTQRESRGPPRRLPTMPKKISRYALSQLEPRAEARPSSAAVPTRPRTPSPRILGQHMEMPEPDTYRSSRADSPIFFPGRPLPPPHLPQTPPRGKQTRRKRLPRTAILLPRAPPSPQAPRRSGAHAPRLPHTRPRRQETRHSPASEDADLEDSDDERPRQQEPALFPQRTTHLAYHNAAHARSCTGDVARRSSSCTSGEGIERFWFRGSPQTTRPPILGSGKEYGFGRTAPRLIKFYGVLVYSPQSCN
ncbi:hypothetical protein DFH06DRAFT_1349003 [Mycena polygramma]|nr:hypothetical protein DFH06DRAFT_1349003 [Mycena polygramma]